VSDAPADRDPHPAPHPDPDPHPDHGNAALSADIRLLGRLLGEVISRQAGPPVFDLVESGRPAPRDGRRHRGPPALDELG
jgi:phosphoenolpyruvate carboxylase